MHRVFSTIAAVFLVGAGLSTVLLWPRERASAVREPRHDAHEAALFGAGLELAQRLARTPRDGGVEAPDASVPGVEACIRVVDADGAPVPNAHVIVRAQSGGPAVGEAFSRQDGLAAIGVSATALDSLVASARTDDGREGALDWLAPSSCVLADEDLPRLEVVALSTLRGVVVDESGAPVAGAELSLLDVASLASTTHEADVLIAPPPSLSEQVLAADPGDRAALLRTARDGTFVLPLHGAGAWAVTAHAPGTMTSFAGAVQLLPGHTVALLRVVLHPGATAVGTVVDESGAPIAHASVTLTSGEIAFRTSTESDGTFRVDGLPRHTWTADVAASGFLPAARAPLALERPDTRLVLARGGELSLTVCASMPVSGYLLAFAVGPVTRSFNVTAARGGCALGHLDALPPGRYRVWLGGEGLVANVGEALVATGETELRATIAGGAHVRAAVPAGAHPSGVFEMVTIGEQSLTVGRELGVEIVASGPMHGARLEVSAFDATTSRSYTATQSLDGLGERELVVPLVPEVIAPHDEESDDGASSCGLSLDVVPFDGQATVAYESTDVSPRLEPGDRLLSIDGARPADGEVYDTPSWYGPCDAAVTLRIERPSTGERFVAITHRTYVPVDD